METQYYRSGVGTRLAAFAKKGVAVGTLLAAASAFAPAHAVVIPIGPQNDVALNTVTGAWGWTLLHRDDYGTFDVDIATILAGAGDLLMLGGIRDGSSTIDVLAATTTVDATTFTLHNQTTTSNGAEWYYNNYSWGFAGLGDNITQNTADTAGRNERDRLSWHTGGAGAGFDQGAGPNVLPVQIDGGYRSGNNRSLNNSGSWDRLIFTANKNAVAVSEPSTLALVGLGLLGFLGLRRRRS